MRWVRCQLCSSFSAQGVRQPILLDLRHKIAQDDEQYADAAADQNADEVAAVRQLTENSQLTQPAERGHHHGEQHYAQVPYLAELLKILVLGVDFADDLKQNQHRKRQRGQNQNRGFRPPAVDLPACAPVGRHNVRQGRVEVQVRGKIQHADNG